MERVIYKKSFTAKMVLAGQTSIDVYNQIKSAIDSRKKVSTRLSFEKETIKFGRIKIGVMKIARKNLSIYLALNPNDIDKSKFKVEDVSNKKSYADYPTKINLKTKRSVKNAVELLNMLFDLYSVKEGNKVSYDYSPDFYYRDFNSLLAQGLIKKYVYHKVDNKMVLVEEKVPTRNVHFTAKLLYCAMNEAEDLYIITNYTNWNPKEAVRMTRVNDNLFTANMSFPEGTKLEFKICRSDSFKDVEKGIWKEEIVNHHYLIENKDLEVEDLIHNFRVN